MAQRVIDAKEYSDLLKRIKFLEKLLTMPAASLYARYVQGIIDTVTYVMPANPGLFTFIDGMNITIDQDSPQVMVDLIMSVSSSATPVTIEFALEVDGQVDKLNTVSYVNTTTTRRIYSAIMVVLLNPGRHQLRAMVSTTTAVSLAFTERCRWMRVVGMILNRRRYLNEYTIKRT